MIRGSVQGRGRDVSTRRFCSTLAALLLLAALPLGGCNRPGTDVADGTAALIAEAVSVLEAHPGDPRAALEAFRAWQEEHEDEISALEDRVERIGSKLSVDDRRALAERFRAQTEPLIERLEALALELE